MNEIIEANIRNEYIQNEKDILNDFGPYIQEPILRGFKAKFDYLNNRKLDNDSYAQSAVRDLANKTYINFCHYNRKHFKTIEDVSLDLNIKNV